MGGSPETATVQLNSLPWQVRLPIERYGVKMQTPAQRFSAPFLRTNNPKLEPYAFNDWRRGFGTRFVRPGHPEDLQGFFDAVATTIWKQAIVLPISRGGIADLTASMIFCSATFRGSLWEIWSPVNDDALPLSTIEARDAGGQTLNDPPSGGGTVFTEIAQTNGMRAYDLIAADKLYCILGHNDDHLLRYSTDGITWTAPATTAPPLNLLTNTATMLAANDGARLAYDGARVILVLRDDAGGQIEVWDSTNGGDTWTVRETWAANSGPTGAVTYLDTDDSTQLYVANRDALWLVDIVAGTADIIFTFNGNQFNGQRMAVHNGSLYVPIDNGANAPFGMKKITVQNGIRVIEDVGLDVAQEIPANMLGNIRWMRVSGPWLFASLGGDGASRNARILALSGIPGEGWQAVLKFSSEHGADLAANDLCTWFDFGGLNLVFQAGGATTSDLGDVMALLNLLAPPTSGVTMVYGSTGDLALPEIGGDAPEEPGGFFGVHVDAFDLVDAAEVLDFEYGLNGAAPTDPGGSLLKTINNTTRRVTLGANGEGISARTLRPNIEFNRGGTSSLSPKLRELVVLFRKEPARKYGYILDIDLRATETLVRNYEQMVTQLETIFDSAVLLAFQEYGQETTRYVEVVDFTFKDWVRGSVMAQSQGEREGMVRIVVEEL